MAKHGWKQHQVITQWNCRGLSNKVGEIRTKLLYGKLHSWAFLLQEHNRLCAITGYIGYQCPSIPDKRAGAETETPGKAAIYI